MEQIFPLSLDWTNTRDWTLDWFNDFSLDCLATRWPKLPTEKLLTLPWAALEAALQASTQYSAKILRNFPKIRVGNWLFLKIWVYQKPWWAPQVFKRNIIPWHYRLEVGLYILEPKYTFLLSLSIIMIEQNVSNLGLIFINTFPVDLMCFVVHDQLTLASLNSIV